MNSKKSTAPSQPGQPGQPAPPSTVVPPSGGSEETERKLAVLRAFNAQAAKDLAAAFGAERWARIIKQCETQGLTAAQIEALCGKMRRTRKEWHPNNELAAMQAAAIGLLIAIGSAPTDDDVKSFEATLTPPL